MIRCTSELQPARLSAAGATIDPAEAQARFIGRNDFRTSAVATAQIALTPGGTGTQVEFQVAKGSSDGAQNAVVAFVLSPAVARAWAAEIVRVADEADRKNAPPPPPLSPGALSLLRSIERMGDRGLRTPDSSARQEVFAAGLIYPGPGGILGYPQWKLSPLGVAALAAVPQPRFPVGPGF